MDVPALASQSAAFAEPPRIIALAAHTWLLSDGRGALYIVRDGVVVASASLLSDGQDMLPCRLHAAELFGDLIEAVVSSTVRMPAAGPKGQTATLFDAYLVRMSTSSADLAPVEVARRARGEDVPAYVHREPASGEWVIGAEKPFAVYPPVDEAPAEAAAVPEPERAGYTWTQQRESVTITFADLPATVTAKLVNIAFSPERLSVMIDASSPAGATLPRISHRKLWAPVNVGDCTWTFEGGVLTVDLDKRHEGTRWTHLFEPEDGAVDVEETLTAEQLEHVSRSLDKYTAPTDGDPVPEAFAARSTLLGEDMDIEVDEPADTDGLVFATMAAPEVMHAHARKSKVVSTAMPVCGEGPTGSITVKRDVDAPLFVPAAGPAWQHTTTYPALDYVLASKRTLRLALHIGERLCVAFEAASPGNVYVYWPPAPGVRDKTSRQAIIRLADSGNILGAAAVRAGSGLRVVLLCERELVVLSDL